MLQVGTTSRLIWQRSRAAYQARLRAAVGVPILAPLLAGRDASHQYSSAAKRTWRDLFVDAQRRLAHKDT